MPSYYSSLGQAFITFLLICISVDCVLPGRLHDMQEGGGGDRCV